MRRLYRDLYEQIALRIVKFPADDFVKDVPEPTPEQVNEQFEKYRRNLEGSYPDETSFGFGYYQLPKVRISWFAIRPYVVARVVNVSDEDVRRHYRENKAKYVKKVPIETAATTQGDEGATSKPVEYRTEEMDINEAWDQIVVELKVSTVISKMNKIISSVEKKADKAAKNPDDVYEGILGNMRKDTAAAEILTKRIESLTVKNEPLENAVKILAEHMKLNGICFPWGTYDGFTIDPKTEISFTAQGTPLGDVLKDITKQAFSKAKTEEGAAAPEVPDLQWSMVEGFDGVLFPLDTGDVMMFPFAASTTALLTGSEISKDRVLGLCCDNPGSSNPQYLISVAFSRDAVEVTSGGGIYVGPKMQTLFGDQVLWRIIGTTPAHVPDSITDSKGLRDKVVADLKLEAAYQTAIKKADEFMALAAKDGVEKAAENEKLKSTKTELFTRRGSSGWSDIEGLDLPYRAGVARLNLMEQVFKLVPENPEPPYPDTPPAVMALYIPAIRATAVVQRIDYKPAYEDKYENIRQGLAGVIMQGAKKEAIEYWFAKSTVMSRLDYKPEEK